MLKLKKKNVAIKRLVDEMFNRLMTTKIIISCSFMGYPVWFFCKVMLWMLKENIMKIIFGICLNENIYFFLWAQAKIFIIMAYNKEVIMPSVSESGIKWIQIEMMLSMLMNIHLCLRPHRPAKCSRGHGHTHVRAYTFQVLWLDRALWEPAAD